jgi:hypothetical protein
MEKYCKNEECDDWSIKAYDHPGNCRRGIVDLCKKFTDLTPTKAPVLNFLCSDGLANISLKKGEDGHWLSVKASNGKQASICIENMNYGPIVKDALVQWAKDQFKDVG